MKIETYLSAMQLADRRTSGYGRHWFPNAERQRNAFRARILRMDAENIEQLAQAEIQERNLNKRIAEYRKEIIEKDEEIRVLEAELNNIKNWLQEIFYVPDPPSFEE